MPFPAQVRQRLRIGRVGPEPPGDLLTRDGPCVEGDIRQQLLLSDGQRPRRPTAADDDAATAEEFEADSACAGHRAKDYTRRLNPRMRDGEIEAEEGSSWPT